MAYTLDQLKALTSSGIPQLPNTAIADAIPNMLANQSSQYTYTPAAPSTLEYSSWLNPYYNEAEAGTAKNLSDRSLVGSDPFNSISNIKDPARNFDDLFLAQFEPQASFQSPGPTDIYPFFGAEGTQYADSFDLPEGYAPAVERNQELNKLSESARRYLGDDDFLAALSASGINPSQLSTAEGVMGIDPYAKAQTWANLYSAAAAKNAIPKGTIGNSFPGSGLIFPALGGLVGGPLGGALMGALSQGISEGPWGALQGGLTGFGIGDTMAHGFSLPDWLGGQEILPPIATSGSGFPTVGFDPRSGGSQAPINTTQPWSPIDWGNIGLDVAGQVPTGMVLDGAPPMSDSGPLGTFGLPTGIPQIPGGTQDPQQPQPTGTFGLPVGFPLIPGGVQDTESEQQPPALPPIIPPVLPSPPGGGGGSGGGSPPATSSPTGLNISQTGMMSPDYSYIPNLLSRPIGMPNYFDWNTDPFRMRLI